MGWHDDGSEEEYQAEQRRKAHERMLEGRRVRMRGMVAAFQKYVATYTEQANYDDYSDKTYLDDMLYGIGLSMQSGIEHTNANGFENFKRKLREHLGIVDEQ